MQIRKFLPSQERDSIEQLMIGHWHEVDASYKTKPQPAWDIYEKLEEMGMVVAYAAYDQGVMIGYVVVHITNHIHYGWLFGQSDVLYVAPGYRSNPVGLKLWRLARQETKDRGAYCIYWHAKKDSAFAKILQGTKHRMEEEIYIEEF